ncbi:unnamed protein product [Spirodela intermedia]|uniref:Uncharacterized protein n=1 Tax=Spirodela intermedia TaxID=51605 RepID=A0A7I8LGK0_SPIIN|nr:unnamed protein product [Spirodela intermedia]
MLIVIPSIALRPIFDGEAGGGLEPTALLRLQGGVGPPQRPGLPSKLEIGKLENCTPSGISPDRLLLLRDLGIGPCSWFLDNSRISRFCMPEMLSGMVPVMLLLLRSSTWSCFSCPNSGRMGPVMPLSFRYSAGGKLEIWLY